MFKAPFFLSRFFAAPFWEKTEPNQASSGTSGSYFGSPFFESFHFAARYWVKSPLAAPSLGQYLVLRVNDDSRLILLQRNA